MTGRVYVLFAVLGITWGSLWLISGGALQPVPLLCEGALRFGAAALLLAAYSAALRSVAGAAGKFSPASGVWLGIALLAAPYACTAWASGRVHPHLRATASGLPGVVYAAMPLAVMLVAREDAGRYLPRLMLGLTGAALLLAQGVALDAARWPAEVVLTVGMLAYGLGLVYAMGRLRSGKRDVVPARGSLGLLGWCALQCLAAGVTLALLAAANGDWARFVGHVAAVEGGRWVGLALAAAISAVTLPVLFYLLERLGPIPAAALQWLVTLTGALETALFVRARWQWENFAGLAMILVALWWVLRKEKEPGAVLPAR